MLTRAQLEQYQELGYHFPVRVLQTAETDRFRASFLEYIRLCGSELAALRPREQYVVLSETHTYLRWVYDLAAHASILDESSKPRIGIAVRYIAAEVKQDASERSFAMLVRGRDDYGHFDLAPPPVSDKIPPPGSVPEAVRRMMRSVMPHAGASGRATAAEASCRWPPCRRNSASGNWWKKRSPLSGRPRPCRCTGSCWPWCWPRKGLPRRG